MNDEIETGSAERRDVAGIMQLMEENVAANHGQLASGVPEQTVRDMLDDMPPIVARRRGEVVGFLMTARPERYAEIPIIQAMTAAYQGSEGYFIYGPVCVSEKARNQGVAKSMLDALKQQVEGREAVLFIRNDNQPSIIAHTKMGMQPVADFSYAGNDYTIFSYLV